VINTPTIRRVSLSLSWPLASAAASEGRVFVSRRPPWAGTSPTIVLSRLEEGAAFFIWTSLSLPDAHRMVTSTPSFEQTNTVPLPQLLYTSFMHHFSVNTLPIVTILLIMIFHQTGSVDLCKRFFFL